MGGGQTTPAPNSPQENTPLSRAPRDCGHFDIVIERNGTWLYRGSPIGRLPLVKLFASVLERDEAGTYWLRTPAGRAQVLIFRTNVDDTVEAGPDHPIRLKHDAASEAAIPYIRVRGRLEARLGRAVYYDLVALGFEEEVEGRTRFGIWSNRTFFPLDD
jgi:hypothetical protein